MRSRWDGQHCEDCRFWRRNGNKPTGRCSYLGIRHKDEFSTCQYWGPELTETERRKEGSV